jgi:hypothetical protein
MTTAYYIFLQDGFRAGLDDEAEGGAALQESFDRGYEQALIDVRRLATARAAILTCLAVVSEQQRLKDSTSALDCLSNCAKKLDQRRQHLVTGLLKQGLEDNQHKPTQTWSEEKAELLNIEDIAAQANAALKALGASANLTF